VPPSVSGPANVVGAADVVNDGKVTNAAIAVAHKLTRNMTDSPPASPALPTRQEKKGFESHPARLGGGVNHSVVSLEPTSVSAVVPAGGRA
jgi:hypothetical protein